MINVLKKLSLNFRKNNNGIVNIYNFRNILTNKVIDEGNAEMYLVRFDLVRNIGYNLFNERFIKWLKLINSNSLEEMKRIGKGDKIIENPMRVVDKCIETVIKITGLSKDEL